MALKRVEALVQPEGLQPLRQHLQELGVPSLRIVRAPRRSGRRRTAVAGPLGLSAHTPVWVEILAQEEVVPALVLAIRDACGDLEGLDEVRVEDP